MFDTGIGISDENKKRLFRQFEKVSEQQINKEGVGLGLYISKVFIQEFGGVIQVESKKNDHSKFIVTLPVLDHSGLHEQAQHPLDGPPHKPKLGEARLIAPQPQDAAERPRKTL